MSSPVPARQPRLDIQIRRVTIHVMEKDKHRSAITVGMLACSMLLLSALFIDCGTCDRTQLPPCPHPDSLQTAYYHHFLPGGGLFKWSLTPPPANDSLIAPYPLDTTVSVMPDTVKCTDCDSVLYATPYTDCFHIPRTVYFHCDACGTTWSHPLPPFPNPALLSAPVSVPCPDPEPCFNCPAPPMVADSVKCGDCHKVWPPWD